MPKKSYLGQFNTTNKDYILDGMEEFVKNKDWVDPYAGNGDLLDWVVSNGANSIGGYDIDPNKVSVGIEHRDTLSFPPDFTDKYVIANPPYLARNKCKDKTLYDKYNQDDLYKIALLTINGCSGGIFIIPLNFLSSVYANDIRDYFFENYQIKYCKIFEESVFDDTDYTVCAFYFERQPMTNEITVKFFPSHQEMTFSVSEKHHWILGEEFYKYIDGVKHTGIGRWTEKDNKDGEIYGTIFLNDFNRPIQSYFNKLILNDIILIRSMDTGSIKGRIGLSNINEIDLNSGEYHVLLGLETSRNKAHVRFKNFVSIDEQLQIISMVNEKLEYFRKRYNSVFLTAFRNSTKSYSRKRIGFDVLYKMIAKSLAEIRQN